MPRHTFKFPAHIRNAVTQHIANAIESVAPERYRQEPPYVAALAKAMEGTAYQGSDGSVVFSSTVIDDRGRNSAEHRFGADLAITAEISSPTDRIRKAIFIQAKLGNIQDLRREDHDFLKRQIEKMQQTTRSPKVMEILDSGGERIPRMISGRKIVAGEAFRPIALPAYFTARVLTTLDGDTSEEFVDAVQDSSLTQIRTKAILTGQ